MAGQVKHVKIFGGFVPDLTAMSLMAQAARRMNTDALIGAVADLMREHGVELINSAQFLEPLLARRGTAERARAERGGAQGSRVRLPHGRRDCRPRHRPDDRREAPGGGRGRGDGRHRRDDRARRSPRRRRRHHHQGGQAEPGHAVRCADRRPGDDPGDARRRRQGVVDRRRQDADLRSRGVLRVGERGGHCGRRQAAAPQRRRKRTAHEGRGDRRRPSRQASRADPRVAAGRVAGRRRRHQSRARGEDRRASTARTRSATSARSRTSSTWP